MSQAHSRPRLTSLTPSLAVICAASLTRKESASWLPQYTTSKPLTCISLRQRRHRHFFANLTPRSWGYKTLAVRSQRQNLARLWCLLCTARHGRASKQVRLSLLLEKMAAGQPPDWPDPPSWNSSGILCLAWRVQAAEHATATGSPSGAGLADATRGVGDVAHRVPRAGDLDPLELAVFPQRVVQRQPAGQQGIASHQVNSYASTLGPGLGRYITFASITRCTGFWTGFKTACYSIELGRQGQPAGAPSESAAVQRCTWAVTKLQPLHSSGASSATWYRMLQGGQHAEIHQSFCRWHRGCSWRPGRLLLITCCPPSSWPAQPCPCSTSAAREKSSCSRPPAARGGTRRPARHGASCRQEKCARPSERCPDRLEASWRPSIACRLSICDPVVLGASSTRPEGQLSRPAGRLQRICAVPGQYNGRVHCGRMALLHEHSARQAPAALGGVWGGGGAPWCRRCSAGSGWTPETSCAAPPLPTLPAAPAHTNTCMGLSPTQICTVLCFPNFSAPWVSGAVHCAALRPWGRQQLSKDMGRQSLASPAALPSARAELDRQTTGMVDRVSQRFGRLTPMLGAHGSNTQVAVKTNINASR